MHLLWLLIGTLAIFSTSAKAIKCYNCDSLHEPRCNEYFDPEGVEQIDCDEAEMPEYLKYYDRRLPATGCLTKIHEGVQNHRFFIRRSCYYGKLDDTEEACEAKDPYVFFADLIDCSICEEDLCNTNASSKLTLRYAFILLALVLGFGLNKIIK